MMAAGLGWKQGPPQTGLGHAAEIAAAGQGREVSIWLEQDDLTVLTNPFYGSAA